MASKDFNTFMDSYIDNIRQNKKNDFSVEKKSKKQEEESVPVNVSSDSVYVIKKPKTFWEKLKEVFTATDEEEFKEEIEDNESLATEEIQDFEQEDEEIKTEESNKGFIEWLKSIFATKVNDTYEEIDEIPQEEVDKVIEENKIEYSNETEENNNIEYQSENKSFLGKLLSIFGISIEKAEEDYEEDMKHPIEDKIEKTNKTTELKEIKEDMKNIAVIATAAFKKLPKEQFKLFKESNDFAQFKEILKKHGVIREKENTKK